MRLPRTVAALLAELIQCGLETCSQLVYGSRSPVMEEIDRWLAGHVVMDCDHIQPVRAQRFEYRSYFRSEHRYVAGNLGIRIVSVECGPCVEAHPGVNRRSHFLHFQVVPANRDLINLAI